MDIFIYALSICIIICILLIWYVTIYNRFQSHVIRMNEAEANIDATLRKRFDLLNKSINIIKSNVDSKDNVLENIIKLRSKKLTNFELDRLLYEGINEFNKYSEEHPELKTNENFMKVQIGIDESEAEIVAFRKYYNDIITDFNKLVHNFPSNLVAKTCKFKHKNYYDGKDMSDNIENDFKL